MHNGTTQLSHRLTKCAGDSQTRTLPLQGGAPAGPGVGLRAHQRATEPESEQREEGTRKETREQRGEGEKRKREGKGGAGRGRPHLSPSECTGVAH